MLCGCDPRHRGDDKERDARDSTAHTRHRTRVPSGLVPLQFSGTRANVPTTFIQSQHGHLLARYLAPPTRTHAKDTPSGSSSSSAGETHGEHPLGLERVPTMLTAVAEVIRLEKEPSSAASTRLSRVFSETCDTSPACTRLAIPAPFQRGSCLPINVGPAARRHPSREREVLAVRREQLDGAARLVRLEGNAHGNAARNPSRDRPSVAAKCEWPRRRRGQFVCVGARAPPRSSALQGKLR
jgi:hypothetical protein